MQVEFSAPSFVVDSVITVGVKFFNAQTDALVKTVNINANACTPVTGTSPQRYKTNSFPDKPSVPGSGTVFYVKVALSNTLGAGQESTASAPFSLTVPEAAADVVVINPLG
jgi:hypothetical protein